MSGRTVRARVETAERHYGIGEERQVRVLDVSGLTEDEVFFLETKGRRELLEELTNDELIALEYLLVKCGDGDDELAGPDLPVPDVDVDYCGHYCAISENRQRTEKRAEREAALGRVKAAVHVLRMNATGGKPERIRRRTECDPAPRGGKRGQKVRAGGRGHVLVESQGERKAAP